MSGLHQRRRRQAQPGIGIMMLAMRLARDHVPPVTLALVFFNAIVYFNPPMFGVDFGWAQDNCLSGAYILDAMDYGRLWKSALFHLSELHLYFNMTSLLTKGKFLEPLLGSERFAVTVVVLTWLQSLIYVLIVWALRDIFQMPGHFNQCAAGFSGVLFALKVLSHKLAPTDVQQVNFFAFQTVVPGQWVYWVELIVIQLMVPHVSFIGHLSGIIAGLLLWGVGNVNTNYENWMSRPRRYHDTIRTLGKEEEPESRSTLAINEQSNPNDDNQLAVREVTHQSEITRRRLQRFDKSTQEATPKVDAKIVVPPRFRGVHTLSEQKKQR